MQIALPEPTALVAFETQKVLVAPSPGEIRMSGGMPAKQA
jgi:hypothetical protein